jgi:hypothetical protein
MNRDNPVSNPFSDTFRAAMGQRGAKPPLDSPREPLR